MFSSNRLLSAALIVFGVGFFLIYPMSALWPSGWAWHEGSPASDDYFLMIVGVYATLGVFLIRAAKAPAAHASLIWFTVWSSVVHSLIMAGQAVHDPKQHGHLYGDVPALLFTGITLAILMSRRRVTVAIFPGDPDRDDTQHP